MINLIFALGNAHGYQLYKEYCRKYTKVHMRSIYYNLKKGLETGEFVTHKISTEQGNFSWGNSAEKIYYSLGKNAEVNSDEKVRKIK